MSPRCTVCANPILRKAVDGALGEKMSGAGISRYLEQMGASVSVDIINRHKQHYAPDLERPKGTRKHDFAVLVRDRAAEQFEAGQLDLSDKGTVAGIGAGLKAQAILDKREAVKQKIGGAELARAIIEMLSGSGPQTPLALDDGMTIDGEAVEVDGSPE